MNSAVGPELWGNYGNLMSPGTLGIRLIAVEINRARKHVPVLLGQISGN